MKNEPLISQELAHRVISDALALRVGRGKRHSVQGLSEASGVPSRCLESYRDGSATPGLSYLLCLFSALGPSFTSDVLAACGQVAHSADNDDPAHMQTVTLMGELIAKISDALADGHVDHREKAVMRPTAQALIEALQPIARAS